MNINSYDPDPSGIRHAVVVVVAGCFLTRLMAHYFNIINIKFRADKDTDLVEVKEDTTNPIQPDV